MTDTTENLETYAPWNSLARELIERIYVHAFIPTKLFRFDQPLDMDTSIHSILTCINRESRHILSTDAFHASLLHELAWNVNWDTGLTERELFLMLYKMSYAQRYIFLSLNSSTTEIISGAFMNNSVLCIKKLPDAVTKIGYRAFEACPSLALEELPDGLTEIDTNVLEKCPLHVVTQLPREIIYLL